ncbi:hypothetical protein AAC03nite_38750 [Alicyclobacillus acidoterrestris]|nr:hypothetical protein AAC03nite_38750 [Alicyclobacillus acidoterrestris]
MVADFAWGMLFGIFAVLMPTLLVIPFRLFRKFLDVRDDDV